LRSAILAGAAAMLADPEAASRPLAALKLRIIGTDPDATAERAEAAALAIAPFVSGAERTLDEGILSALREFVESDGAEPHAQWIAALGADALKKDARP
jgi:hypothetical protein